MAQAVYFTAHKRLTATDDYGQACSEGYMLAARFSEYLRDNPGRAGDNTLGRIFSTLAEADLGEGGPGYLVGFCAELERMIYRGSTTCDPMAVALAHNATMGAILERAEQEQEG